MGKLATSKITSFLQLADGGHLLIKAAGISDVGLKREVNEDAYLIDNQLHLYIVADGVGGHRAGEVASKVAVDLLAKTYSKCCLANRPQIEIYGTLDPQLSFQGNYLLSGIRLANRVIHEMASANEEYYGMGTTAAALAISPNLAVAANIGDSRVYLIRHGRIERLSNDHTVVSEQIEMGIMTPDEAVNSPLKHVLTKYLGSAGEACPNIFELRPANNDRYILCTDGLTDLVSDEEILDMTMLVQSPQNLCRDLVDLVLKRGGDDNTTVVAVFCSEPEEDKKGLLRKTLSIASQMRSREKIKRYYDIKPL